MGYKELGYKHPQYWAEYYAEHAEEIKARTRAWSRKRFEDDPKGTWLRDAWRRAGRRKSDHGMPVEPHDIDCPDFCPVLGIALFYGHRGKSGPRPDSPSLDRINPSGGYVPGNVRVISNRANTLLSNATADELGRILSFRRVDEAKRTAAPSEPDTADNSPLTSSVASDLAAWHFRNKTQAA